MLEGCTAPMKISITCCFNVELVALDDAEIKYSTVQIGIPGNKNSVNSI